MADVSIIVPIYNVEKYLDKCLSGILSQTFQNFEVILINDGSQDNCKSICDEYAKKDERIKVIHQENQGSGSARNKGLELASGKYIYFCDADDYMEPSLLEENFQIAEKYGVNMVVFGYYDKVCNENGMTMIPRTNQSIYLHDQHAFREHFELLFSNGVMYTLWNKLYKRDFLEKYHYRFGNERVGQDTVFNYQIYKNIDKVYINEKIYYHYLIGRTNSAVNKYRADRFGLRYEETLKLEQLIKSWNYEKKYKQLLINDWLLTLTIGINNLFLEECPLSNEEKKREIHQYIHTPKIAMVLQSVSVKTENISHATKFKVFLLKKNQINLYYRLMKYKKIFS